MDTCELAPIVLFVYNRLWHTKQTIEALKKNELAELSELFVFSDGPKNADAEAEVELVRDYIQTICGFKKVHIINKEKNWGLAKSIIDGVTTIVNKYGKIIVLEDDLVTSPYFLKFMNDSLNKFSNCETVFGVTGFAYPIDKKQLSDTFFLKDEGCWGWATWNRAWKYFNKDTDMLINTFTSQMISEFNFDDTTNFWSQVILNQEGSIDTWAIYWYATIFLKNGLFLHPKETFIKNIGHDGSGVHCSYTSEFDSSFIQEYEITFPLELEVCKVAREEHKKYFLRKKGLINRAKQKLSSLLGLHK